jgi:hypothetical protein
VGSNQCHKNATLASITGSPLTAVGNELVGVANIANTTIAQTVSKHFIRIHADGSREVRDGGATTIVDTGVAKQEHNVSPTTSLSLHLGTVCKRMVRSATMPSNRNINTRSLASKQERADQILHILTA